MTSSRMCSSAVRVSIESAEWNVKEVSRGWGVEGRGEGGGRG